MSESKLDNTIRAQRERLGLSQQALAERVGVRRQAIIAIEAGRQTPSTTLALQLARTLSSSVESLFHLEPAEDLEVRLAEVPADREVGAAPSRRVALGRVGGGWAAHRIVSETPVAADGIVRAEDLAGRARVRPLLDERQLERNVLVAGCAPLLAVLARRVADRFHDARMTWLATSSRRALDLLDDRMVHVAGVHLSGPTGADDNVAAVRERFPDEQMLVVNLTTWREGFVVSPGNPLGIRTAADLLRPGLRIVGREEGASARQLVSRLLAAEGAGEAPLTGPVAFGHEDVARRVAFGAADVGVAIEGVARAHGLEFVPLAEERFDLVVPASVAAMGPVSRLFDALDDSAFRLEVAHLPGYDSSISGHVTTVDAA